MICFALFFVGVFVELGKRMRTDRLAFAYFFLTIALLGSAMAQETFWFQKSLGTVWIMYMIVLALILRQPYEKPSRPVRESNPAPAPIYFN